jgi:hypothetical protein
MAKQKVKEVKIECGSCENKENKENKTEPIKGGAVKKARASNSWLIHVKKYREDNPDTSYKECLQKAKLTYKKGGSLDVKPADTPVKMEKASAEPVPVKKMKKVKKVKKVKTME